MHNFNIDEEFKEYFPELARGNKLKDFQKKVIENVVLRDNTLCIMPTGGGKSWIYWLSGLLIGGTTIVISPLTALIDEQSEKIKAQGYEVLTLHGGIDSIKQTKMLSDFANRVSNPRFIFVSPEKIATDGFFEYCIKERKEDITMIAIDEVHCVSQWGASFRPFYKRIPNFLDGIYNGSNMRPRILALTATLNPKEVNDICIEFNIAKANIIRDNLLMRKEITLKVLKFNNESEKEEKLWDIIKIHRNEKILVYVYRIGSKHGVEELSEAAIEKGYRSVYFHGEMSSKERREIIENYKNNNINLIFATNAFGMGIDIPDIRVVIHYMIPESVEQYYQEIGRAARDKGAANAYLLYSNKNIDVKRRYFIDGSFPKEEKLIDAYKKISGETVGLNTLAYFEDEDIQQCLPYYLNCGILDIICKGFSNLKSLYDIKDTTLFNIVNSTKTKGLISTVNRSNTTAQEIVELVYESILKNRVKTEKPLDKRLIINANEAQIVEDKMKNILEEIEEKRQYKHGLLNYLVFLVDGNLSSLELHQEIARYLGVDRHMLNKIYSTVKGDLVRSKSEVIIANLLYQNQIQFEYEKKLYYDIDKWVEPDFTILLNDGRELYWEHLGMLGLESYDKRWSEKQDIYDKHFNGKLLITYEGATISDSAIKLIETIKSN